VIEGAIAEGAVPGLLRELYVGRRTGMLSFERGSEQRGVRFRKGHIIHADTNVREDRMGEVLVRRGRLSAEDLKRALGFSVRDGKRLGAVLVETGVLTSDALEEALALHVHEILSKVFSWRDGRYRFTEEDDVGPLPDDVTLKVSTGELILQAARSVADPDVVRYCLGDIDRVLGLASDPLLRFQRVTLTPSDGYVLSRVDGTLSARDLVAMIPLPAEEVHRSLFGLLSTAMIEFLAVPTKPRLHSEASGPRREHERAASAQAAATPADPARASEGQRAVPPATREEPRPARPEAPGRAERPAAAPPSPAGLGFEPTVNMSALRSELEAALLRDAAARAAASSAPAGAGRPSDEAAPGPAQPAAPAAEAAEAEREDDPRRLEIIEAHSGLATRTHFEVLGVDRDATEAVVKEAYFRLAKRFHPDVHHDPALADLRDQIEAIFVRLGEAYEVLCNPRLRASYDHKLDPSTGRLRALRLEEAPDPEREAREVGQAIQRAARSLSEDKLWEAISILEHAILRAEGPARLEARILLARAYMRNVNWVKQAEELLRSVARDAPENLEALLLLAEIYRMQRLTTRAAGTLRRLLELDPGHKEAREQLAALTAAESGAKASRGGLLKKLFPRG